MKAVAAWTTTDGRVFTDFAQAKTHEKTIVRTAALKPVVRTMLTDIQRADPEFTITEDDLLAMMLAHGDALEAALRARPDYGRRKKKAASAATPATPVTPAAQSADI